MKFSKCEFSQNNVHGIVQNRDGKIANRRRTLAWILDRLPYFWLLQRNTPHVFESRIPIIPGKNVQIILKNGTAMGTSRTGPRRVFGYVYGAPGHRLKLVLPKIVDILQVWIGVNVALVASEDVEGGIVNDSGMMIPEKGRQYQDSRKSKFFLTASVNRGPSNTYVSCWS